MFTVEIKVEEVGHAGIAVTYQTGGNPTPAEAAYARLVMAGTKGILDTIQKQVGNAGRIEGPAETVAPLINKSIEELRGIQNN